MNRQQRRAQKPARTRPAFGQINHRVVTDFITTRLYCASTAALNEEQRTQMLVPFLTALESLRTGTLGIPQYDRLVEGNIFAFELAARLHRFGTDSTKAILESAQCPFETAADHLADIAQRYSATKKFIAKAAELQSLRESFDWLDQLLGVATEGHALSALSAASQLVQTRKQQLGITT